MLSFIDDMVDKIVDNSKTTQSWIKNNKKLDAIDNNNVINNSQSNLGHTQKEGKDILLRQNVRTLAAERTLHRLREENDELKHNLVMSAHREHDLQRTVAELQSTLQTMGKTVASQTATMRTLSQEMQRRGPYHLIKERHHAKSLVKEQLANANLPSEEMLTETSAGKRCNQQFQPSNKHLEKHGAENFEEETNSNLRGSYEFLQPKHRRFMEFMPTAQGKQSHMDELHLLKNTMDGLPNQHVRPSKHDDHNNKNTISNIHTQEEQEHKEELQLTSCSNKETDNVIYSEEQDNEKELSEHSQNEVGKAIIELKTILFFLTRCISQSIISHNTTSPFANVADVGSNVMPNNLRQNVYLVQLQPTFCSGWDDTKVQEHGKQKFFLTIVDAFKDVILTTREHVYDELSKTIFFDTVSACISSDVRHKNYNDYKYKRFNSQEIVKDVSSSKYNNTKRVTDKISDENKAESEDGNAITIRNDKCELLTLANTSSVLTIQLWQIATRAHNNESKCDSHNKDVHAIERRGAVCIAIGQLPLSMLLATAQLAKQTRYRDCTSSHLLFSPNCFAELHKRQSEERQEEKITSITDKHSFTVNVVHTIQLYSPTIMSNTSFTHQLLETVCNVSFDVGIYVIAPHWFAMTHCNRIKTLCDHKDNLHAQTNIKTTQESSFSVKTPPSRLLLEQHHRTTRSDVLPLEEECHEPHCEKEASKAVSVSAPKSDSNTASVPEATDSSDAEIEEVTELEKNKELTPVEVTPLEVLPQGEREPHTTENTFPASAKSLYVCVKSASNLIENATELLGVLGKCHPRVLVWVDEQLIYTIPTPTLDKNNHFYNSTKIDDMDTEGDSAELSSHNNVKSTNIDKEQGVSVEWSEDVAGFTTIVQRDSTIHFEVQDVSSTGVDPMGTASVAVNKIVEAPLQMILPVMLNGKQHGNLLVEFCVEVPIATSQ